MYRIIKKYICFICCGLIVFLSGCNHFYTTKDEFVSVSATDFYFDTTIQINIMHEDANNIIDECFSLCAELENTFSRTKENSELYLINHRTTNQLIVSDDMANVIRIGLEYSEKTDGAFDITICPVSELWDFKSDNPTVPSDEEIQNALKKVDYRRLKINGNEVSFEDFETKLDLGAIAKGYCADKLKEFLVSKGVMSGFVNLGGNVLTIGSKPDGSPWNIGIQEPFKKRGTIIETVEVEDLSVVSAGIYERYFELDGEQYYHVIDSKTGYPVKTDLYQVTVISQESVIGDVISTSCLLLGEERAKEFVSEIGFSNIWLHLGDHCAMIRQ